MTRTITRLYDTHTQAVAAIDQLEAAGIPHDRISLISNNSDNWHAGHTHRARDRDDDDDNETAEGAGEGAAAGAVVGGAGGLLAGLGMLAIPGLGPVVAAGWLASTLVGAAAGAAAGGVTGGILGALKDAGHSDEDAHVYAEGVRRGGTLVSVRAEDSDAARIEALLNTGTDAATRGAAYRTQGWSRFDEQGSPYTADEIAAERARSGEARSFATGDDGVRAADRDEFRNDGVGRPIGDQPTRGL